MSSLFLNTQPLDLEIKTLAVLCFLLLSVTFKVYLSLGIRFCKFTTPSLGHPPCLDCSRLSSGGEDAKVKGRGSLQYCFVKMVQHIDKLVKLCL